MRELKVGDWVTIKRGLKNEIWYGKSMNVRCVQTQVDWGGRSFKIIDILSSKIYLNCKYKHWSWAPEMFEDSVRKGGCYEIF